jgi:hypothetical protein
VKAFIVRRSASRAGSLAIVDLQVEMLFARRAPLAPTLNNWQLTLTTGN